ncbi:Fanconi anemia group I protein, partial [Fasciola gigantica]
STVSSGSSFILAYLFQGWITKLLNSGSSTTVASTQMTIHHSAVAIHTRDLVVLLPLLVRLCRARAQIGSTETAGCNALIGLDRVLAWLVRLMRAGPPPVRDAGAMINAARVQLIGQAVWLAHLVGTFPDATNRTDEDRDQNTSMDFILGSLASDLHQTVGDTSGDHDSSIISCGGSESTVNFPMITRSTALSLVPLLCSTVRQLMIEFEWLLTTLTTDLGGRLRSATVTRLHQVTIVHYLFTFLYICKLIVLVDYRTKNGSLQRH